VVANKDAGTFSAGQIKLLETFADQAVIAVENVRLFRALQERTEALTKSVGQLTALGEVGQAISSTLDVEKVLQTIVSRAVELTGLDAGALYESDEDRRLFNLRASQNIPRELLDMYREEPIRFGEGTVGGTVSTHEPIQVADILEGSYQSRARDILIRSGARALLAVPLLREGHILGALAVIRNQPGEFVPEVVELLRTFATQSALAIQNAKLFREIQEKSAQLEVANKHKSDFLANMSHELRTPLNAIIGFSEVMIEQMFGELNEKQLDYQKDIHESGKHLLSLINDILDLSKIEAGRMELELSRFDLPTAVSNAVTLIRERAQRHGIALGVEVDPRLGDFEADERKVKQILLNLLSNAVKFTPDGGRVDVTAKLDTDKVAIAVKDTGVGIAPADQASLFEEFKQFGNDRSRKAEGTGLGLALTRRLVELHGGQILVDSAVGQGSTFRVLLPVRH
jgi:signal transduction histidine kinase